MQLLDLLDESRRQLEICNACRYCEGYCAVFPAMERRTAFTNGDVEYLANLCHDCRACFYACPFASPHEFAVNLPAVLSEVRSNTYTRHVWPAVVGRLATHAGKLIVVLAAISLLIVFAYVLMTVGPAGLFGTQIGEGAFYRVVPHLAMAIPALAISAYVVVVMLAGGYRFWREVGGTVGELLDIRSLWGATVDAFELRYLRGGGDGCYYPADRPSKSRVVLHSLVFYGFMAAFASTTIAFVFQAFLGVLPPYDYLSLPVVLGVIGGVAMTVGCTGLMLVKLRSDPAPAASVMRSMDFAFLAILDLASITGLLVVAFRETAAMGVLLGLHLGVLGGLYVSLPYSKFVHVVYRYAAIIKHRIESRREAAAVRAASVADVTT
ncbi:MAG: tricarballylate utilization 4Fe-4S protein TcuB [Solirubrobacterales bacterium]